MKKPYRCQNQDCSEDPAGRLIFDFWAEDPVCPKCQADQRHPKRGVLIVELEVIHFDPPSKYRGLGLGHLACNSAYQPGQLLGGKHVMATGDPGSVNCPNCRESDFWKEAKKASSGMVPPAADLLLNIDAGKQTVTKG